MSATKSPLAMRSPASIAASLPKLREKELKCTRPSSFDQARSSSAVASAEPSSTKQNSNSAQSMSPATRRSSAYSAGRTSCSL